MKTVIEMAREAGWTNYDSQDERFERFAELVRADERNRTWTQDHWTEYERSIAAQEREACATLCENLEMHPDQGDCWDIGTLDCADAIRERGAP